MSSIDGTTMWSEDDARVALRRQVDDMSLMVLGLHEALDARLLRAVLCGVADLRAAIDSIESHIMSLSASCGPDLSVPTAAAMWAARVRLSAAEWALQRAEDFLTAYRAEQADRAAKRLRCIHATKRTRGSIAN